MWTLPGLTEDFLHLAVKQGMALTRTRIADIY
jgi:hypothetical protein